MNLADFAGGVGAAAQGATQRQYAEQGLARGQQALETGALQQEQMGLQTEELKKQYEDLKGTRNAFSGADNTQAGFEQATKYALNSGNVNLAMQLQQLRDTYNGNQLHHTAMQALSGADPADVMKTWQAYNPNVPIDTTSARRITAADLQQGGEFAGQGHLHPGDIIAKRSDNGGPILFPTYSMAQITGLIKPGKWTFSKDSDLRMNEFTGEVEETPRTRKSMMVTYKVKDADGNEHEMQVDTSDSAQYMALRQNVLKQLGAGDQTPPLSNKISKEIWDATMGLYKSQFTALSPEEQKKVLNQAEKAEWVYQSGGHDERGQKFTPTTALNAAQSIIGGTKSPADYGIQPQGAGAGQPQGQPPSPDSKWMIGANGQPAWHRPKPGAPGQWQMWQPGAGAPAAPAAPAAPTRVPPPPGTPATPAAPAANIPLSVRSMNREQATARAQEIQQFLQSGQQRTAPGFGFMTRESAQAELAAIQSWLPNAPPGPPAGYTAPPFQGPAGMPGGPGYSVGGVARAVKPSMVGGLARVDRQS